MAKKQKVKIIVLALVAGLAAAWVCCSCCPLDEETEQYECPIEELPAFDNCAPLEDQTPITCLTPDEEICADARMLDENTWVCCVDLT